jgi:Receptor family ligand binding region
MPLCNVFIGFIFTCASVNAIKGELIVPGLLNRRNPFSLVSEGDVNIGLLTSIHASGGDGKCSVLLPSGVMWSLSMRFAVAQINKRNDILPNVTLGFVQMDTCTDPLKALEVSVYFVKDNDNSESFNCGNCSGVSNTSYDMRLRSYDVIGTIVPWSSESVAISPVLTTFRIPVMALSATANSLSDKTVYPYFLRMIPPELGFLNMLLQVR